MARQPTTRLAVSGQRFLLRRMEHALLRRDVRMIDEPMRAEFRALLTGCVVAAVVAAGCVVVGFMRPQHDFGHAQIVMAKESGALYVRLGDTWHPALNLASARLIAGNPADPVVVKESELRKTKRGALLGIPGAPATLSAPLGDSDAQWTVCHDDGGTTVIAGPLAASGGQQLSGSRAMLVRGPSEPTMFLLYGGHRARVDRADAAVRKALNLDSVAPQGISTALLNTIPELPPISVPAIRGAGGRGPSSLGGLPIGSVVRVARAGGDDFFAVLDGGVQRVGPIAADIIRFGDSQGISDIVTITADAISVTPMVERLPVTTYPNGPVTFAAEPVVCAHWSSAGDTTVLAGPAIPLPVGQTPVALAQADGAGPNVDAVFIPPGRSFYVQSTQRYLVSDTGVRFGVRDAESAAALGFPNQAPTAPWSFLKLLADGPELSRAGALVVHDGITADPRGAPPR